MQFRAEMKAIRPIATHNRGMDIIFHIPEDWDSDITTAFEAWKKWKGMDNDGNIAELIITLTCDETR